ncbi:MAG: SWIM zinc finger family protein [Bacteroidia bacterium]|nr:SWIM zinc finger family protein [Bacteroidia bacterium]
MKIPLKEFEQHIDETILQRGYQYFKKGLVNEPEEIGHGEYEAIVEGTNQYTVQLSIKNDVITEYVCSCPYDMGPVCKHVVAVIFHLQQNELNLKVKAKKNKSEVKKTKKKKTVAEQVDELLEKLSHDNLKDYIKERCVKDSSFRQLFLANFAYLVIPESQALYAKQIHAILCTSADRNGFIGYSEARFAGNAVYDMVQRAEKLVEMSNYQTAMYMACAVLEEMTEALQYADDSNGDIGGCIDPAVDVLSSIVDKPVTEQLRKELFNYCITSFKKEIFKGWDWHFSMLDLATSLIKNSEEAQQIHSLLDNIKPSDPDWNWDFKSAQRIRLELISKMEGDEKATQFLEQNIANSDFRKKTIETALSKKDYNKVIALAEEGIKLDDEKKPGLANDWRDYLLKVYISQSDTDNIIKYARYLFLNANREKKPYYSLMKKFISLENWDNFVKLIITDITNKNRWVDYSFISQIYIWEERWDKLFDIVKKNASLDRLDSYEKYLIKDYATEITDLYQTAILNYMVNNMGRSHYQIACRYLRKMIKMGVREKANFVIEQLKVLYPKRKALMEELQKV